MLMRYNSATAVFFCAFSTDPKATERPAVQAVQLDKPVVDFTVSEDGRIWALVDGENDDGSATAQNLVRLLEWRSGQVRASLSQPFDSPSRFPFYSSSKISQLPIRMCYSNH